MTFAIKECNYSFLSPENKWHLNNIFFVVVVVVFSSGPQSQPALRKLKYVLYRRKSHKDNDISFKSESTVCAMHDT